ncbi:hypothetical protein N7540_011128 [Penicillium herquei]|nr:hypothetical protein N7540_011128 [Penicillium herquei]
MANKKRQLSTLTTDDGVVVKRRLECPDPEDILRSIQKTFVLDTSEALFSIGDEIDLTSTDPNATHESRRPVTIRWDSGVDQGHVRKISFPAAQPQAATADSLTHFLKDCEPATFGRGNQEVLDKSYRLASKMDVQHFSCDYSPYDNRVMEKVSQALAFRDSADNSHRGLRAELYKLNVYSAPSGMFKAHVDTPRSEDQMGSLVVCLPTPHEGGDLTVRRQGRQNVYSWGQLSASHIQWAAFYSDEEHEVGEVTQGHRVTLTYNLYWVSNSLTSMESLIGKNLGSLSWVAKLDELSKCKLYLKSYLSNHSLISFLLQGNIQEQLKGLDMLVYQAFKRLGGNVRAVPVLDDTEYKEQCRYRARGYYSDDSSEPDMQHTFEENLGSGGLRDGSSPEIDESYVGKGFHSPFLEDQLADEEILPSPTQFGKFYDTQQGTFNDGWYSSKKVTWLNRDSEHGGRELAMTTIVVGTPLQRHKGSPARSRDLLTKCVKTGNEPATHAFYSTVAIIAEFE